MWTVSTNSGELYCESEEGARIESKLRQGEGEGSGVHFIEDGREMKGRPGCFMANNGVGINGGRSNGGIEVPLHRRKTDGSALWHGRRAVGLPGVCCGRGEAAGALGRSGSVQGHGARLGSAATR
jgi:hypothetical protein